MFFHPPKVFIWIFEEPLLARIVVAVRSWEEWLVYLSGSEKPRNRATSFVCSFTHLIPILVFTTDDATQRHQVRSHWATIADNCWHLIKRNKSIFRVTRIRRFVKKNLRSSVSVNIWHVYFSASMYFRRFEYCWRSITSFFFSMCLSFEYSGQRVLGAGWRLFAIGARSTTEASPPTPVPLGCTLPNLLATLWTNQTSSGKWTPWYSFWSLWLVHGC